MRGVAVGLFFVMVAAVVLVAVVASHDGCGCEVMRNYRLSGEMCVTEVCGLKAR